MNAPLIDIIQAIGLPAALKLVSHFGGGRVYLPHPSRLREGNAVAAAIGTDAARELAALWPQTLVTIPRASAYLRRQRDRAILQDLQTMSVRDVAWKYVTTERNVYMIQERGAEALEEPGAPSSQGQLF